MQRSDTETVSRQPESSDRSGVTQEQRRPPLHVRPEPSSTGVGRLRQVGVLGTGCRAPDRVLGNAELERMVDTNDQWITARTGMKERRIAAVGEATSDLAVGAAQRALADADVAAADIDLVIVATTTPDHYCTPPTACLVQHRIGATRAGAFDLNAACTGFVEGLAVAHGMIASGVVGTALVVGAEKLSSVVDYTDRETCVLFGDGAGAVVVGADASGGHLLDHVVGADGSGGEMIKVVAGGSRQPTTAESIAGKQHFLRLEGRKVFRFAVAKMAEVVEQLCARNGCEVSDLALLIPHQANMRIIEAAADRLGLPPEKVFANVERYGNTSTASVPICLDEVARAGRLRPGDLVCMVAFGGGLTWAGSLLRW